MLTFFPFPVGHPPCMLVNPFTRPLNPAPANQPTRAQEEIPVEETIAVNIPAPRLPLSFAPSSARENPRANPTRAIRPWRQFNTFFSFRHLLPFPPARRRRVARARGPSFLKRTSAIRACYLIHFWPLFSFFQCSGDGPQCTVQWLSNLA